MEGISDKDMLVNNITWIRNDTRGLTCKEMDMSKSTVFILYGSQEDAALLFKNCQQLWKRVRPAVIVTENIVNEDPKLLSEYPDGIIGIRRLPAKNSNKEQSMLTSIDILINATKNLIQFKYDNPEYARVNFQRDLQLSERTQAIPEFRRTIFTKIFRQ